MPVAFGADQVRFDPRTQTIDASGNVHVDERPFYLTSDTLKLRRVGLGVEVEGEGRAAFCPCVDPPIAVRFRRATVAPPHDLVLYDPVLEILGVPIGWAPAIWLRDSGRFGLLPPEVAWRGGDGLLVGGGVHIPWREGDIGRGIDLRAGGYTGGGVRVGVDMRSAISETIVTWDRWRGDDGVALALLGSTAITDAGKRLDSTAWEVDALRGQRAVKATTDLDAAARPFDRAQAQTALRLDGWTIASGVRTVALRGSDLLDAGVGGPIVVARRAESIARAGAYDATVEGGMVSGSNLEKTSFARGEAGSTLGTHWGSVGASLDAWLAGDVADDGARMGLNGAAHVRAKMALPLERAFASPDEDDPWIHRVEPYVAAGAMAVHLGETLSSAAGRGTAFPDGGKWVVALGFHNSIGRWGTRAASELEASGGAVGDEDAWPLLRVRAVLGGRWLGLRGELARVFGRSIGDGSGGALLAEARAGATSSVYASVHVVERDGVDPILARAIVEAPLEPASRFLAAPGWTGGARVSVPIGSRVTTRAGADVDLDARYLVAALGALELHDPCQCLIVRANAAHRIGREGIDIWLSVDLPRP
jgi:hypothetical protein